MKKTFLALAIATIAFVAANSSPFAGVAVAGADAPNIHDESAEINESESNQTPIEALAEFVSIPAAAFTSLISADEASDAGTGDKDLNLPTISGHAIF